MVFAGIYPEDPDDYEELEKSLQKLCLTDGSVKFNYESSAALGSGFRCGFLGMLHLDVFRQRLDDEYDMISIITAPTVSYQCKLRGKDKELKTVDNPLEAPAPEHIE
jgi:translation elongation factor EF-4